VEARRGAAALPFYTGAGKTRRAVHNRPARAVPAV